MPRKTSPLLTDEDRAKRIRETAREIGADATSEEFSRAFEKIVPQKPNPDGSAGQTLEQSKRFTKTARQIASDETGETPRRAFEKAFPSKKIS